MKNRKVEIVVDDKKIKAIKKNVISVVRRKVRSAYKRGYIKGRNRQMKEKMDEWDKKFVEWKHSKFEEFYNDIKGDTYAGDGRTR